MLGPVVSRSGRPSLRLWGHRWICPNCNVASMTRLVCSGTVKSVTFSSIVCGCFWYYWWTWVMTFEIRSTGERNYLKKKSWRYTRCKGDICIWFFHWLTSGTAKFCAWQSDTGAGFSPSTVGIIRPKLQTNLRLYVANTRRANGRSLATYQKECYFGNVGASDRQAPSFNPLKTKRICFI
jgi:hypothetical protein